MKKYCYIFVLMLMSAVSGCSDRLDLVFKDYYVCIKDENGFSTSKIGASLDNMLMSYYVNLVSPILDHDLVVEYEVIPGDGLKEGVDYELVSSSKKIRFSPGVTKMPIRINYLSNPLDEKKDNKLTITLVSCSDKSIILGYPGPDSYYRSHVVTKY